MLIAEADFKCFKEVVRFVSYRDDKSLTDIAKNIATTPIEPWYGGCLIGICYLEGEETVFYETAKTERIITFLPSKEEIVCFNMDNSEILRADIEEIIGNKLTLQEKEYLWIPVMVTKRILSDETKNSCSMFERLEWSMQDIEKIQQNNQQVITKINQIEKFLSEGGMLK